MEFKKPQRRQDFHLFFLASLRLGGFLNKSNMQLESLDLHGYILADAMDRFVRKYNWLVGQGWTGEIQALRVIHGKGMAGSESVIREELRKFLRSNGTRIKGF